VLQFKDNDYVICTEYKNCESICVYKYPHLYKHIYTIEICDDEFIDCKRDPNDLFQTIKKYKG